LTISGAFKTRISKLGHFLSVADGKTAWDELKEMRGLLDELSLYLTTQFRHMNVNQALFRRLLSSVYNMALALAGGKAAPPDKIEDGFYDDLPARFENIIIGLEKQYGLKT